jgi:hypothetical protein
VQIRYNVLRGLFYELQFTPDLNQVFEPDPAGFVQAVDSSIARTNSASSSQTFYRVISALAP